MARAIYQHELSDPDFQWLINTYREINPDFVIIESTCMPVILVRIEHLVKQEPFVALDPSELPLPDESIDEPEVET